MAVIKSPKANTALLADDAQIDLILRALAARQRREILTLLAPGAGEAGEQCCSSGEVCGCDLVDRLGIGAPTVSHHMKMLIDAGLVSSDKRGLWVHYRLEPGAIRHLIDVLSAIAECATPACEQPA